MINPILVATLGLAGMSLLIVLQVPIGIAMAVTGFVGFGFLSGWGPAITLLSTEPTGVMTNPDLAVIPLFILMGTFASFAGLSEDLFNVAYAFLGHRRGGLGFTTVGACGLFGSICGSSPAAVATFAGTAFPQMIKRKYSPSFASGCVAAGGTLSAMVPPSIVMVIYAVMTEQFIITIFIAAIIPAIMQIAMYFLAIAGYTSFDPYAAPPGERLSWQDALRAFRRSWASLTIMVAVFGGIYSGVFTVNEAAAVGAGLALLICLGRRKMTAKVFMDALNQTAVTTAMIYIIIIGANVFIYFLTVTQMPKTLVAMLSSWEVPKVVTLGAMLILYIILGAIFDELAAMLATLPLVLPLVIDMGYSPVWWGIINVVVIEIGMLAPPIGMNVFVLYGVLGGKIPLKTIYQGIIPFLFADLLRLALLLFFPVLCTWLPSVMK